MRRQRGQKYNQSMEALESRLMPAATIIGLPAGGTFVDADGDTVTVRATGTTGTVTFTDATAGVVEDGDDIAGVVITGASSDFTLTYSFDASGGNADTVLMGDITSTRVIKGIFSIPLNNDGAPKGAFTLGSFVGPGFSLHGGLSADNLVGRTADDLGVQINNLETNRSLNFRGNVDGDILIKGNLNGNIAFGDGVTATSDITVRGSVSTNGKIAGNGAYLGTATFVGTFFGSATIDGDVDGKWIFRSSVPSSAKLHADQWSDVDALRDFGGQLTAFGSSIDLSVGGNINGSADIVGNEDVVLTVTGGIGQYARISSSSDIHATVGGNVSGTISAGDDVTLDIGGALAGAVLAGDFGDLTVDRGIRNSRIDYAAGADIEVTGGVVDSVINANSGLSIDVTGSVTRSQLNSSSDDATVDISGNLVDSQVSGGSSDVTLNVTGNIINSKVMSDESGIDVTVGGSVSRSTFVTSSSDLELTVTGNLTNSTILSPDDTLTLDIGGDVVNCSISGSGIEMDITGSLINTIVTADEDDTDITVGKDVVGSTLSSLDDDIQLEVGRDLIGTAISSDTDASVDVTRHMTRSSVTSPNDDVTLGVGGNMTNSSALSADDKVLATVGGNFTNSSVTADTNIDLNVTGSVIGTITSDDGNVALTVGGSLTGKVLVDDVLTAKLGSLNGSLTSDSLDLFVTGNVSATSVIQAIQVGDFGDADLIGFRVGGTFAGTLTTVALDSNEDIVDDGGDGINDLVVGNVLATAKFNIGVFNGNADEVYRFGGKFLGHLAISQTVNVNLEFNGDVHSIVIGGSVGVDIGGSDGGADEPNTITVNGKLTFLSSNSLFVSTGAGDGDFQDGAGVVTGNLITNGFTKVIPQITVAPV